MNFKFFKVDWYPDKASNKNLLLADNVEVSQSIINSMAALKQLHFTLCILLAFADTADKNNQCQRTWQMLSRLSLKQAQACYKNKEYNPINVLQRFNSDLQMSLPLKFPVRSLHSGARL